MKSLILWACIVGLAMTAGGCASIVKGTTQEISVNSDPDGADCVLTREGQPLGTVKTPGQVKVSRDSRLIHVDCAKEGYANNREYMNARYETMSAGNIILGGIVGVAIDQATGASNRYDTYVLVRLEPLAPGQVATAPLVRHDVAPPAPPIVVVPTQQAAAAAPMPPAILQSGTWQTQGRLAPEKSPQPLTCGQYSARYTFDLHDNSFTGTTGSSQLFATKIAEDGVVNYEFTTAAHNRLSITGNAKTRQLELRNLNSFCVWVFDPTN